MTDYRVGIDIGGTFTDIVVLGEGGQLYTKKVSSTVGDYAGAIATGLEVLFNETALESDDIREVLHGTTVASNAILEKKGVRTGLITTKGFRDILEIRDLRVPQLYHIGWNKPTVLVPRYLRVVVDERVSITGDVSTPLSIEDAENAVERLVSEGVEAIAVCLLNSFSNPIHERQILEIIQHRAPHLLCSISSEVHPEIKEYERTSTTVVNAYIKPIVSRYLQSMREILEDRNVKGSLLLMQSSGGLTTVDEAIEKPVNIIESGPAAGVIGAQMLARHHGLGNIITLDMGGTTAKASIIEKGIVNRSKEFQVGGGVLSGSRLLTGAGYLLSVPAVDLAEVGAGGGSIITIDAAGSLCVGPESAGADPGPLCYGIGGSRATVTDSNIILGYLNPERLVGGELKLNRQAALTEFERSIAVPLGMSVEVAAYGAHRIAAANMIRAIRSVSSERGRDPRDYSLCAFGGNGPVFAATMAVDLGIAEIIIPPAPGLFSAFGLLYADVEHHYSATIKCRLDQVDASNVELAYSKLEDKARSQLQSDGFSLDLCKIERSAELHYQGQTHELSVDIPSGSIDSNALTQIGDQFHFEHERTYGHRADIGEPVELVNVHVVGIGLADRPRTPKGKFETDRKVHISQGEREVFYGPSLGWLKSPILTRGDLYKSIQGPCIIEEYDSTCVVPPGSSVSLDVAGNIRLNI